jgi:hypothetical protein
MQSTRRTKTMNEIIETALEKRKQGFITQTKLNEIIDQEFKRIRDKK